MKTKIILSEKRKLWNRPDIKQLNVTETKGGPKGKTMENKTFHIS